MSVRNCPLAQLLFWILIMFRFVLNGRGIWSLCFQIMAKTKRIQCCMWRTFRILCKLVELEFGEWIMMDDFSFCIDVDYTGFYTESYRRPNLWVKINCCFRPKKDQDCLKIKYLTYVSTANFGQSLKTHLCFSALGVHHVNRCINLCYLLTYTHHKL